MTVEGLCKRLQLWGKFFRTLKATSEGGTSVLWSDECALFMGREGHSLGQALLCPALHSWITEPKGVAAAVATAREPELTATCGSPDQAHSLLPVPDALASAVPSHESDVALIPRPEDDVFNWMSVWFRHECPLLLSRGRPRCRPSRTGCWRPLIEFCVSRSMLLQASRLLKLSTLFLVVVRVSEATSRSPATRFLPDGQALVLATCVFWRCCRVHMSEGGAVKLHSAGLTEGVEVSQHQTAPGRKTHCSWIRVW